ncbi:MAG: hypothetical protein QOH49_350 [Acidobacteriota bacterium]|jgi:hypothetical protein|nr:hypothetical protein [Acidobacteriota bacterium]
MKSPNPHLRPGASGALVSLFVLLCFASQPVFARGDKDWKPLDPSDLSAAAPAVEKDADAEALFWEVYIDDSQPTELSLKHYVRIKVFNERGRDSQSKVELPYYGRHQIKDIAARVVKPDGTIVELKKEDVFDRTVVKISGEKMKVKSFALPGVEPGSIVEYRWREVHPGGSADGLRLSFQRNIPVRSVAYYLKPFGGMRYRPVNMGDARFEKDKDGFFRMAMTNMPAFREEPRMPPEDSVRAWAFLYYSDERKLDAEQYWKETGKKFYEILKDQIKPNDEVKTAVAGIVGDAKTDAEKLQRIYDFCRTRIKNVSDDAAGLTPDEREKLKDNKSPSDTLKRAQGTGGDIDFLFAALARAAGFDARVALSGNNDDFFFDRSFMHYTFLGSSFVAVRVGDAWQFFSPAEMYTPYGMLGWPEEGQDVLVTDAKEPVWVRGLVAGPEKSVERRTGKFKLSEDGTLEGNVKIEYTGHLAHEKKEYNDDDSPAEREKTVVEAWKARMGAEVTDLHVENVTDPIKPFVYTFHVRVPAYATRTGKRLFLQPAFFEKGLSPLFPTTERHHEVYFHYPWSEDDQVEITLPEGFALDNAESPGGFNGGDLSKYEPSAGITQDGRTLIYTRKFYFGKGGDNTLRFPVNVYPNLKNYFDEVSKRDGHTIALKQGTTTAAK